MGVDGGLRVRWLGRVRYRDAWALQRRLFERSGEQYLLLLEHPHVFTLGVRALPEHVLVAGTSPITVRASSSGTRSWTCPTSPARAVSTPVGSSRS